MEGERELRIWRLSWPEFANLLGDTDLVILPVGVVEAHGPHLPLGTDFMLPERLAQDLAPRLNAAVAPAIPYGVVGSLSAYPGTMGISQSTLESLLFEVLRALAENGFDRVILINGHGGSEHVAAIKSATRRAWRELGVRTVVVHWWIYAETLARESIGGGHAAGVEAAAVMATYPDLVKTRSPAGREVYRIREGIEPFPAPGSVLLYRDQPADVPGEETSREFYSKLLDSLVAELERVLDGWDYQEIPIGEEVEEEG